MPENQNGQSASTVQPTPSGLKESCYLVCLLALFLSISPRNIACLGLFLLLLFAPLNAAHWLNPDRRGRKVFLLLSVCSAGGVLTEWAGLPCLICFCLSLLFWSVYLCQCVLPGRSLQEQYHAVLFALFSSPSDYFIDIIQDWKGSRKRLAVYVYKFYLLIALFTILVLLLAQANQHFSGMFQVLCTLILKKLPLITSCLLLALFPAAFIYGFLNEMKIGVPSACFSEQFQSKKLGTGESSNYTSALSQTEVHIFPDIPWGALMLLLIAANCSLLMLEIYYTAYLKEEPPADYRFYDIFVILVLLGISSAALYFAAQPQQNPKPMRCVSLSISCIGLVILACLRLGIYIYCHGLWDDRILFCLILLMNIPFLLQVPFDCSASALTRRISSSFAILLAVSLIIPKGLFLPQVNTQIFIHKYQTHQLAAQRAEEQTDQAAPTALSSGDLRLDLVEGYGIEAVPALTWLVRIEDVAYQNQTLGQYARSTILNCICADLKLLRTGNDAEDLASIYSAYADIPRYRLSTRYALALQYLDHVKDAFDETATASSSGI